MRDLLHDYLKILNCYCKFDVIYIILEETHLLKLICQMTFVNKAIQMVLQLTIFLLVTGMIKIHNYHNFSFS